MFVVCVYLHVREDQREAFLEATRENARNTIREPGNLRFDVIEQADDPTRFMLYEVYRDEDGFLAHKQTAHYAAWAETAPAMLAEPRAGVKYTSRFPDTPEQWNAVAQDSAPE